MSVNLHPKRATDPSYTQAWIIAALAGSGYLLRVEFRVRPDHKRHPDRKVKNEK